MALHHRNHHVPKEVLQSATMVITPCVAMAIHLPDLLAVLVPAKMARNLPAMAVLLSPDGSAIDTSSFPPCSDGRPRCSGGGRPTCAYGSRPGRGGGRGGRGGCGRRGG